MGSCTLFSSQRVALQFCWAPFPSLLWLELLQSLNKILRRLSMLGIRFIVIGHQWAQINRCNIDGFEIFPLRSSQI